MNLWNPEQIAAAQRASVETSLAITNKAFASFQKVVDLNLTTIRSGISENKAVLINALSGKSPQEWGSLPRGAAEPFAPRSQAYYNQLFAIFSNAQLEFITVANGQFAEQQRKLQNLIDDAAQHAPAAAESAIIALNSAITAAGTWYETTRKAAQQAIHVAESNAEAISAAVLKTAKRAA
jgi:phasin family protein